MITQDSIEALKARLDVVDVVGSYVELKKAGANYKAPCPFHDEKTASFVVSPQKQIYHCFGCGAGGDSVKFVMEYEKLNYPEALEKLADSYNFTLSYTDNKHNKPRSQVMDKLNEWYQTLLTSKQTALEYIKDRGIYESSIEKFGIGYAPDSNATINYIKSQSFTMAESVEMGVVGYDSGRNFARFIERITFPIHSANGSIVGFGGRTITGHQAKYVNSPETPFFNKSRLLYAYHHAKQALYKHKEIIITEGYLDVIMLHQAGFDNAVATLGTALTHEHLPLLRKGEPKIIMAYDGDKAGRAAALKASKLLSASGFNGGVIIFAEGLDPADMVKNGAIEELAGMIREPKVFIEFVLDEILSLYDLRDPKAKESCMQDGLSYLKTLSPLLQEEYKTYLASRLGGLGVNPSLLKITNNTNINQNVPLIQKNTHKDMWELSLIKTVIEKPHFINQILDEICSFIFNKDFKESLRELLPGYIKYLAYKFETKRELKDTYDKLEGLIWQDLSEIFDSQISEDLKSQYEEEVKEIDREIELNPMNIDLYKLKIKILIYFNQYNDVLRVLDNMLKAFPEEEIDIMMKKASILKRKRDLRAGLDIIEDLLKKYPKNKELLSYKAYWFQYLDKKDESLEIIQKLIDSEPDIGIYHDNYGEILMHFEEYEEAVKRFLKALVMGSDEWYIYQTYIKMGICYKALGNHDLAVKNLKKGKDIINKSSIDPDTKQKWLIIADLFLAEMK